MAGIDKAAIAFSIAIVAIGVGFAFYMGAVQDAGPVASAPIISEKTEVKAEEAKKAAEKAAAMAAADAEAAAKKAAEKAAAEAAAMAAAAKKAAAMAAAEAAAEVEAAAKAAAGPQTHSVSIPMDSGTSQDCVKTDECYIPYEVTINVGDTVTWINDDQLPHTVTAGDLKVNDKVVGTDLPNGFDSSIVLKDGTFSHTFETAGTYPYLCIVHPWMVGNVIVN